MKLAVVTHGFPTYSNPIAANFLEPFLAEIVHEGHEVLVLTPQRAQEKPLSQPYPVETFLWSSKKLLGQLKLWKPRDLFSLLRFIHSQKDALFSIHSRIKFDHVLVVWVIPNAIAVRALKRSSGVGYSTWSLGTDIAGFASNPLARPLLKGLLKEADHLFANSRKLCTDIAELSGSKAELLSTYRPLEEPAPQLLPKLDKKAFHFLCVARLEPVKGPDILLEAFFEMRPKISADKNVHLHYLGDGSMRQGLKEKVRQRGMQDRVHFHGMVPPVKVAAFFKVVDCLILPSRSESMPVAFWEAQAAGLSVIGTDVGDLGWAIHEFGQGIVVKPADIVGLTEAMRKAVLEGKGLLKPNKDALPPNPKRSAKKFLKVIQGDRA